MSGSTEDNPPLTQAEVEQLKKELEATKAPEGGFYSIQEVAGLGARIVRVEEVAGMGRVIRETGAWLGTPQEVLEPIVTRVAAPAPTTYKAAPPEPTVTPQITFAIAEPEALPPTPIKPRETVTMPQAIEAARQAAVAGKAVFESAALQRAGEQLLQQQMQADFARQMQEAMGVQRTVRLTQAPELPAAYVPTVITAGKPELAYRLEAERQKEEIARILAPPSQITATMLEPQKLPEYIPTTIQKYVPPEVKPEPTLAQQFMAAFKESPLGKLGEAMTYGAPIPIAAERPKGVKEAITQFGETATALTLTGLGAFGRGAIFFVPSTLLIAESAITKPVETATAIGAGIAEAAPKAALGFELLGKKAVTGELAAGEAAFLGEFAKAAVEIPFQTAGAMAAGTMIGKGVTVAREKIAEFRGFEPQRAVVEYAYAYEQPELEKAFGTTIGKGEVTAIGKRIKVDFEAEFLSKRLPAELKEQLKGIEDVGVSIGKMKTTIEQPRFFGLFGKKVTTIEQPFAEFYVAGKPVYQMPLQTFEQIGEQFKQTGEMVYQLRPAPLGARGVGTYQIYPEFRAERLVTEKLVEVPLPETAEGLKGVSELYQTFGEGLEAYQFVKRFTITPPIDVKVFKPAGLPTMKPLYDIGVAGAVPVEPVTLAVPTVAKQISAALEQAMATPLPPVFGAAEVAAPVVTAAARVAEEAPVYAPSAMAMPKAAERMFEVTMPSFAGLEKMDVGVTLAPALRGREAVAEQLDVGELITPVTKTQLRTADLGKQLERQLAITTPKLGELPQERLAPAIVPKLGLITPPVEIPALGEITLEIPAFEVTPPVPPVPPVVPFTAPPLIPPFEEKIRIMPREKVKGRKVKLPRRPSRYVPSLIGLVLGGTIPEAPKGLLGGFEIRYPVAPKISRHAKAKVAKKGRVKKAKSKGKGLFGELENELRRFGL